MLDKLTQTSDYVSYRYTPWRQSPRRVAFPQNAPRNTTHVWNLGNWDNKEGYRNTQVRQPRES